jgi:RES domain-containing protein
VIRAWRIVRSRFAEDAFSGEGARRHSGRWHSAGQRVVYTASSLPLATLELLVHVSRPDTAFPYSVVTCWFPEAIVEDLDRSRLPADWRTYPAPAALQQIGNEWLRNRSSAVLCVPSAVLETEMNYLLNPEHDDFRSVDVELPSPLTLDPRLVT